MPIFNILGPSCNSCKCILQHDLWSAKLAYRFADSCKAFVQSPLSHSKRVWSVVGSLSYSRSQYFFWALGGYTPYKIPVAPPCSYIAIVTMIMRSH